MTRETLGVGKLCDLLADAQLLPAAIAPALHSNLADVFWFLGLELGDPGHWTDLTERSCLRLLSRASTSAMRCSLHVWSGCTPGDVAVE